MNIYTPLMAVLIPALAASISAQESEAKAEQQFVLAAGDISVQDLVDQCAAHLGRNILATASECATAPPIRLRQAITTDANGCEDLLSSLLYRSGFALTVVDAQHDLFEIIMINGSRGREVALRAQEKSAEAIAARPNLVVPVATVVELKHINAQLVTNALRPFFATTGSTRNALSIGISGSRTSMIITGMQNQVAEVIRMIQRCDVKQPPEPVHMSTKITKRLAKLEERLKALEERLSKSK